MTGDLLARLDNWSLTGLPRLNVSILDGDLPWTILVETLARHVLVDLPQPEVYGAADARRLLVHLAFCGAAVARHYQERAVEHRKTPEQAFVGLRVGVDRVPFQRYFARVAAQTRAGHCARDSYITLVQWNVPTTEVYWSGERVTRLPGAFGDHLVRTYTNDSGEREFFLLTKKAQALERAANTMLEPISTGELPAQSAEAIHRVRVAAVLLTAMRQVLSDFAALPPEVGLRPGHFMDVFRQFAVHWELGDLPPSGAQDPEALKLDLLLGLDLPDLARHTRRQFPVLLAADRAALTRLLARPALPVQLLAELGLDGDKLAAMSAEQLRREVRRHPALAAWSKLLGAHARAAGVHLMLAKKFLFRPAEVRANAGIPDTGVVPRNRGTTGMDESFLERLTRLRHSHLLTALNQIPRLELLGLAGFEPLGAVTSADLDDIIHVAGQPDRPARAAGVAAGARSSGLVPVG